MREVPGPHNGDSLEPGPKIKIFQRHFFGNGTRIWRMNMEISDNSHVCILSDFSWESEYIKNSDFEKTTFPLQPRRYWKVRREKPPQATAPATVRCQKYFEERERIQREM